MPANAFACDGFALIPGVLDEACCAALAGLTVTAASGSPGTRCLLANDWCRTLASTLRAHPAIAPVIPDDYVAVQCTYFEKSRAQNWLVPVHQDLGIPVQAHVPHPALGGWAEKEGSLFVQPPVELLARLVALRLHLDPCLDEDGPLQFVPGTHTLGRLGAAQARALKQAGPLVTCAADRGAVLMMRPLALHASSKATGTSRRRVLHFVFGPAQLPHGLAWAQTVGSPVRPSSIAL